MADTVFVSHAMKDRDTAYRLVAELEKKPTLRCWVAPRDIPPGASWPAEISKAIRGSRLLMVLLSADARKSQYVPGEVALAAEYRVPIMPIRLDDAPLSDEVALYLSNVQHMTAPCPLTGTWAATLANSIVQLFAPESGAALDELKVDDEVAEKPPPPLPAYDVRITRNTPACIILLVDCSNSMNQKVGGSDESRRAVVARAINDVLHGLESFAIGERGARPYFDIAILGYGMGGGTEVHPLLPGREDRLVSIVDISANPKRIELEERRVRRPDGTVAVRHKPRKIWLDPVANKSGRTVARRAFLEAQKLAEEWIGRHPQSMPPIVLNITDGRYDRGEDPEDVVRTIQELGTEAGNALVFNCHLSDARAFEARGGATIFPSDQDAEHFVGAMRRLYDQSSILPAQMLQRAREANYEVAEGARGYAYNADAAVLVDFLEVGTQPMSSVQ